LDKDDISDADDSSSETEDHVLENDNVVADDFQLSSDEEYDEERQIVSFCRKRPRSYLVISTT